MKIINETATPSYTMLCAPFGEESGSGGAQDIASRIEDVLEPQADNATVVLDDGESLPEGDDTVLGDDEGSVDEESDDNEEGEASSDDLSLASYLGIDDDKLVVKDDGSVMFNAIVDGEAKEVDLKELAKSYQLQGHVNNKSISLENDKKEFEKTRDSAYAEMKTRLDGVANLHKVLEDQLLSEYNSVDWATLRVQNPSEWSALRQEFSERASNMQQSQQLVSQEAQKLQQEQHQELSAKSEAHMKEQLDLMVVDNPSWSDDATMKTEVGKIGEFLTSEYDFTPDDLRMVQDRRLMRMIQDAKSYRDGKKGIAGKKVVNSKLPKFQKPGASVAQAANLAKARAAKATKKAVKDSGGSVESIANSLINRM